MQQSAGIKPGPARWLRELNRAICLLDAVLHKEIVSEEEDFAMLVRAFTER